MKTNWVNLMRLNEKPTRAQKMSLDMNIIFFFSYPRRKSSDQTAELDNLSLKVEKLLSEVVSSFCLKVFFLFSWIQFFSLMVISMFYS